MKTHELPILALFRWLDENPSERTLTTGFVYGDRRSYVEARSCERAAGKPEYACGDGASIYEAAEDLARKLKLEVTP